MRKKEVVKKARRKGYFIGIGIGIAIVVIAVSLLIGFGSREAGATILLKDEQGNLIATTRVILDGSDLGSATGEVKLGDLDVGNHTIIIIWDGAEYTRTFYFSEGEQVVLIQLPNPVSTHVSVWDSGLNEPIPNVKVYVDGEIKGTTDTDGECTFTLAPGDHVFRLSGNGVSYEGSRAVSMAGSSITFEVGRVSTITVSVSDELTGDPIKDAEIYLDGVYKGETSTNGRLEISNVTTGTHQIEARYGNVSESESVTVSPGSTSFSLSFTVSRTITLTITDEETGIAADAVDVYIDDTKKGTTTQNGQLVIEDVLPGRRRVGLIFPLSEKPMEERYVDVGTESEVPLSFDMPNPVFEVTVSPGVEGGFPSYCRDVEVTLTNMGYMNSKDTVALVFYYWGDDLDSPVDSDTLVFGDMSPGDSRNRTTKKFGTQLFGSERVFVIVVDRWDYTPQSGTVVAEVTTPESQLVQLVGWAGQYLDQHDEIIGELARMFLSMLW